MVADQILQQAYFTNQQQDVKEKSSNDNEGVHESTPTHYLRSKIKQNSQDEYLASGQKQLRRLGGTASHQPTREATTTGQVEDQSGAHSAWNPNK
jgi:hypothetical protein